MIDRLIFEYDIDENRERTRLNGILTSLEHEQQESLKSDEKSALVRSQENYTAYKNKYRKNLRFDPKALSFGNHPSNHYLVRFQPFS